MLHVNQQEINTEEMIVLFVDECHLHWGDVCGYVWGKTENRVELAMPVGHALRASLMKNKDKLTMDHLIIKREKPL